MKKLFILSLFFLLMSSNVMSHEVIPFTVHYEDDQPLGHGYGRGPIQPPVVYIEDYTLTFVVDHPDYELTIKDEDGEVVYSTVVYSALTQVTLPSTLAGDYVIELTMGNWLFVGWIFL